MRYVALSDEELEAQTTQLSEGCATFCVTSAEEAVSSTGNDMIKLKIVVEDENGASGTVFDHLVSTPKTQWKIKQFLCGIGQEDHYKRGELLASFCDGAVGKCRIKKKADSKWFEIAEYINPENQEQDDKGEKEAKKTQGNSFGNDPDNDLPF